MIMYGCLCLSFVLFPLKSHMAVKHPVGFESFGRKEFTESSLEFGGFAGW